VVAGQAKMGLTVGQAESGQFGFIRGRWIMGRYAMVVTATGAVDNVIVYDGVSPFNPPAGIELVEDTGSGVPAEPGGTWNGSAFVRAVVPEVPTDEARTRVLMREVTTTKKFDEDTFVMDEDGNVTNDGMIDKTADEIAAEKAELKTLLLAELDAGDLAHDRTQMLLRLERE